MTKYYTPSEYLCVRAEAVKVLVGTQDNNRFVILYDRFDEFNTIISLPAEFERDINDGYINPAHILVKVDDSKATVVTCGSIGMSIHQSVEEYVCIDDVYCVIKNGYVFINCEDILVKKLKLENPKEDLPEGCVDNDKIDIIIDCDGYMFAVYN